MLTPRQNLIETVRGGKPDRFVNQYEPFKLLFDPITDSNPVPEHGQVDVVDLWGIHWRWDNDQPGEFPINTPENTVIKDIRHWEDFVKAPTVDYPEAAWQRYIEQAESVDRSQYFVTAFISPGIFEMTHHLGEIKNALINLIDEPKKTHELIRYLKDFELRQAEKICDHLHPDALYHHDDWGSQSMTFMSPFMFDDFFTETYREIYGYWRERGVEVIVHHSDSYAATLVPYMIDMGIDIWQGVVVENDISSLIKRYGNKMSYMGGINEAYVDFKGWSPEVVVTAVRKACDDYGQKFFIPCTTHSEDSCIFPGVYNAISKAIDDYSPIYFREHNLI